MTCGAVLALLVGQAELAPAAAPDFKRTVVPILEKHCYECHGGKHTKGDLDLKQFKDDAKILPDRKVWLDVLQQVNAGEMPPKKHPTRPTAAEIAALDTVINSALERAEARARPDPGRLTVRRLNRTEYNNTIRDLVGLDINPAEDFPADDIGNGFDNMAEVLSLSPVHLERYLAAAENIAAHAVLLELPVAPTRTTLSIFLEPSNYRSENSTRPVTNTPAELFVRHKLLVEGDYLFRARLSAATPPEGEPVAAALVVGDREVMSTLVTNLPRRWNTHEIKLHLPAGEHRFAVSFLNPSPVGETNRMLFVRELQVIGPADTRTEFQKHLATLGAGKSWTGRTREVVSWFLTRAFRRPATKDEMLRYVKIFQTAEITGGSWEAGAQELLQAVLCSPKFLFRIEADSEPKNRDTHPIDEYQLASRLSYFLWSTMPDEELFALAARKKLAASLDAQVQRMLKDPRAGALVENFALQWLQLQRLRASAPDSGLFPSFDEPLRRAMQRETELFLSEIIREDRSVLDLVDADFTYLNEPLARHYGIVDTVGNRMGTQPEDRLPGGNQIRGEKFVRVSLPTKERGGLLTQASVLTVTSNPTRTSPVKRGKWMLEQILGTPPPPAPPGVPELDSQKELQGTLRQRMEQHRENPNCAACHAQMDALGFAFENYDAIGRFRTKDGDGAIDPKGALPDGKTFSGPAELKAILKGKQSLVAQNITEKLLTYALGRGLEYYDARAVRKITGELAQADYRFSALVKAIVNSEPFRLRRGRALNQQPDSSE